MTKVFTTEEVPARHRKVLTGMACDLCGKKKQHYKPTEHPAHHSEWGWPGGEMRVEVSSRERWSYDDGEHDTQYEVVFDICPDCFKNTLVPFLKSEGAEPTIFEVKF